jgi:hypothetical protein
MDIITLWFKDRISELICRLLFPAFVSFSPLLWFVLLFFEDFISQNLKSKAYECVVLIFMDLG